MVRSVSSRDIQLHWRSENLLARLEFEVTNINSIWSVCYSANFHLQAILKDFLFFLGSCGERETCSSLSNSHVKLNWIKLCVILSWPLKKKVDFIETTKCTQPILVGMGTFCTHNLFWAGTRESIQEERIGKTFQSRPATDCFAVNSGSVLTRLTPQFFREWAAPFRRSTQDVTLDSNRIFIGFSTQVVVKNFN